ncbi:unnamed protein product, partial [marine sediment metagenome]
MRFGIVGMTCASCVTRVERSLKAVPGVAHASVNLATEAAEVVLEGTVPAPTLVAAVEKAGYAVATSTVELAIEGMTCASCVARVERALKKVPGVLQASVNLATERARVQVLGEVPTSRLVAAVADAGYGARPLATGTAAPTPETRPHPLAAKETRHLILAIALSLPLVLPMLALPFG